MKAPPTLLCSSPSQVLISILHQALPPVLPMSRQSPIVSSPSSAHKPFLLVWDSMSTLLCLPLMLTLSWRCLKSSELSSTPDSPRRSPAPIRRPPSLRCRTSLAPLLPLILTNFHLLPPLAMAERIEPLPGEPRAMPSLSFLHSILRLVVGLPDTSSEVLAPPRLPLQHTPSLDRASPQPTPSFKSEPMKRICLPGSAADPMLVEGLISGPDSLRWRLTRSLTVDDANSRSPATAMLAIQEGQLQEVVAESQLRPIVMAMTPAQLP